MRIDCAAEEAELPADGLRRRGHGVDLAKDGLSTTPHRIRPDPALIAPDPPDCTVKPYGLLELMARI